MLSVSKAQRICCIAILIIFIPITSIAEDNAASVKVGPGFLSPGIDLKILHDDNLLSAETAELETFGFIVSPHAAYEISDNIKKFVRYNIIPASIFFKIINRNNNIQY